jgi:hypothetical protein
VFENEKGREHSFLALVELRAPPGAYLIWIQALRWLALRKRGPQKPDARTDTGRFRIEIEVPFAARDAELIAAGRAVGWRRVNRRPGFGLVAVLDGLQRVNPRQQRRTTASYSDCQKYFPERRASLCAEQCSALRYLEITFGNHSNVNLIGMVLLSLNVRNGLAKLPPVASAPPMCCESCYIRSLANGGYSAFE